MTTQPNPYDGLERLFHEPNRLSIMSAACAAEDGISFSELKAACGLTDGNLNRHLKVLVEARTVHITKAFVKGKPRTTVSVTLQGTERFNLYLENLASVLKEARRSVPRKARAAVPGIGMARA